VAEWFKALVLKTSVGGTPPWVRIPPLPPPSRQLVSNACTRLKLFATAALSNAVPVPLGKISPPVPAHSSPAYSPVSGCPEGGGVCAEQGASRSYQDKTGLDREEPVPICQIVTQSQGVARLKNRFLNCRRTSDLSRTTVPVRICYQGSSAILQVAAVWPEWSPELPSTSAARPDSCLTVTVRIKRASEDDRHYVQHFGLRTCGPDARDAACPRWRQCKHSGKAHGLPLQFCGDTIHPSTMQALDDLGLLNTFLELPHQRTTTRIWLRCENDQTGRHLPASRCRTVYRSHPAMEFSDTHSSPGRRRDMVRHGFKQLAPRTRHIRPIGKLAFSASMKANFTLGGFLRTRGVHPPRPYLVNRAAAFIRTSRSCFRAAFSRRSRLNSAWTSTGASLGSPTSRSWLSRRVNLDNPPTRSHSHNWTIAPLPRRWCNGRLRHPDPLRRPPRP
jgi:hypothetical protein